MAPVDPDKALGAMLGLAVGNALGVPFEGQPRQQVAAVEMTGGGPHDLRPGQGNGVTQLAIRLATTLAQRGGYDSEHVLRSYVAWARTDPPAMNEHMREVLQAISAGSGAYRATSTFALGGGDTSDNGAVMRTTPIGVTYASRPDQLRDVTLDDAALTHFDPLAGKVALLHNQVVGWLVTDGPQRLVDELKEPSHLDDRIEDVVIPATSGVRGFAETLAESQPGAALTALAIGLVVAFNADTFEQGIAWAVSLGGDAPANGAVAGALLGARLGAGGIPSRWIEQIDRRAEIDGLTQHLVAVAA